VTAAMVSHSSFSPIWLLLLSLTVIRRSLRPIRDGGRDESDRAHLPLRPVSRRTLETLCGAAVGCSAWLGRAPAG
jgi:hypothetical protein